MIEKKSFVKRISLMMLIIFFFVAFIFAGTFCAGGLGGKTQDLVGEDPLSYETKLWDDVIAVVVQPGVEEKDAGCTEYDRSKAVDLMAAIKDYPTLVFEGHSTDYQTKHKLRELVEDGVGVLKVGPGLTFAMREALFALANIEKEAELAKEKKAEEDRIAKENSTEYILKEIRDLLIASKKNSK